MSRRLTRSGRTSDSVVFGHFQRKALYDDTKLYCISNLNSHFINSPDLHTIVLINKQICFVKLSNK